MFNLNQINKILQTAQEAGLLILQYYNDFKNLDISIKQDDSPVTKADLNANFLIIEKLHKFFPDIAIVSEENSEEENLKAVRNKKYFMIDPLDGTKSFIKKSDEFTVNIALIENNKSVFGVIYAPAKDLLYFTDENNKSQKITNYSEGGGVSCEISVANNHENLRVICTKREPERSNIIEDIKNRNLKVSDIISIDSSYKFCLIAEGAADLYLRKVNIKAWDVAAGHAIVKNAGGKMINSITGREVEYNAEDNFDIPFFEVSSSKIIYDN